MSPSVDEDEVSCGGLWLEVGVDANPLLVPLVASSDELGSTLKGVVVVGA